MTRIWTLAGDPSAAEIAAIASLLRDGGIALLPTDTIYGLHAVATSGPAVDRIVALKGRDAGKPLVVLGASSGDLEAIGVIFRPETREALAAIWPGPLTAILPLRQEVAASRGAPSLAVRVPDVPWLRKLLEITGPLASTSANLSGQPPISEPGELLRSLQESVDGIVDAGRLAGEASSLVDFTGVKPVLIRSGDSSFTQKVWKTLRKSL